MNRKFSFALALVGLMLTVSAFANDGENSSRRSRRESKRLVITARPWGPTQADVDAAKQRAASSEVVRRELNGSKYREVGFEYLEDGTEIKGQASRPPTRFRVTYYNYSTDMALYVEGNFAGTEPISAHWTNAVPGVGAPEINAAYDLIAQLPEFAARKQAGQIQFYEAMPPTTVVNGERLLNIGISNPGTGENEIVGVSFKNNKIIRYENNAPPTSAARPDSCGLANSNQGSTANGLAGQATITVNDTGGNTLWEMLVVRPSASSGRNFERSGLEIRDVKYKGKLVLKRGHVPILNVQYTQFCGPYRDWQYSEGFFNAPDAGAQTLAPGIRLLAPGQIATTAIESRNDTGNYQGVAIYTQDDGSGPEVVLVTEMNAGWYRYIMEWRFATDGTIRPRYGFGSVADSCVCFQRTHHVYWRFDFDVVNANNKVFLMDRGRRYQKLVETEADFFKKPQTSRMLMIQNSLGDEAYQLIPGTNDGTVANANGALVDAFGAGDFWIMRYKSTSGITGELDDDDGPLYPGAYLAPWVNGESTVDQDVVVWYAAHQVRVDDASRPDVPQAISGAHVMGPVLRPVRW
ncbi:MAG: hypothetical protein HOP17_16105 [Acidobacteria bacterium]|nr:hypothetical protein [Acidobacteriota bacterium]